MTARVTRLGGEGPPLLLVHGFGADRFGWAANAHALFRTHSVWAAELPGHGAADDDVGDGTPAALAVRLAQALEDMPADLPVVAHSLGAAVALHLRALDPGRVARLILIAPAGLGAGIDRDFVRGLPAATTRDEAEALLSRLFARTMAVAPMADHVLAGLSDARRRAALATVAAAFPDAPPPPAVPAEVPLVLIWGAEDRIVPPPGGPVFGRDPVLVPGAGHMPHVEAAGRVNRLLAEALA